MIIKRKAFLAFRESKLFLVKSSAYSENLVKRIVLLVVVKHILVHHNEPDRRGVLRPDLPGKGGIRILAVRLKDTFQDLRNEVTGGIVSETHGDHLARLALGVERNHNHRVGRRGWCPLLGIVRERPDILQLAEADLLVKPVQFL